ncbi:transcriptional regulator [Nocardioides hwasunensis]|uniref:Transcriptional regulator n=1 Tax=Nocardioides hwasunensis TaxID=397258 RepID=A0ABR8MJS3_9ACTN|nr:transcriptional regulator [Nocardioides hwasunensis]MBD3916188.1 transcriptional regulator [Nocardioides hwasunensis]
MSVPRFDEVVHAPNRLQICALLVAVDRAEFATLRESLGVADSVLSKHLKVLVDAGYVVLAKPAGHGRVRTWASITGSGRTAFAGHVAELQRLAATADPSSVEAGTERY